MEKWVPYYWPIVEQDIPQKHGGEKTKPLAFRGDFKKLTNVYPVRPRGVILSASPPVNKLGN